MAQTHLSNFFKLLSVANEYPTRDRIHIYTDGLLRDDIVTVWRAMELPEEPLAEYVAALDRYVGMDKTEALNELRREFSRLFYTENRLLFNCQGPWTSKKKGKKEVLFMVNETSTAISDFMYRCGVKKREGYNDSLDMLENEWKFLSMLAEQPEYMVEKGVEPLDKLDEFMDTYMKAWVPGFAEDVAEVTRVPYFAAFTKFQADFVNLY